MTESGLVSARLLAAGFFAVLFLQSGLDKVLDWRGNRTMAAQHFAATPLKRWTGLLLGILTLLELLTGVTSAAGVLGLVSAGVSALAYVGAVLAALTVLSLVFGQRVARDRAGAAGLVPYFIAAVGSVLLQAS